MWTKLDDGILDHPKIAEVGILGFAWFAASLVYANRNLTNGFVPYAVARRLCSMELFESVEGGQQAREWQASISSGMLGTDGSEMVDKIIGALLEANLWEEIDGGYQIHHFLHWNPSRARVLRERRAARLRMKSVRANIERTSSEVHDGGVKTTRSHVPSRKRQQASTHDSTSTPSQESLPVYDSKSSRDAGSSKDTDGSSFGRTSGEVQLPRTRSRTYKNKNVSTAAESDLETTGPTPNIADVVDAFRALPVPEECAKRCGGPIAALVRDYGPERVLRAIAETGEKIRGAFNPLSYLHGVLRRENNLARVNDLVSQIGKPMPVT
ncbi:MAG TPA: hypothetical protein VGR71_06210 [Nitrospira sp.]|nr:hypothetical protein [Nitrospira sp.]